MKHIPLTRKRFALVDDNTYDWLRHWKWTAHNPAGESWYAVREGVEPINQVPMRINLHRMVGGHPQGFGIQFKDGNSLNVQHDNLRYLNYYRQEVEWKGSSSISEFRGVKWDKRYGLWKALLTDLIIGYYITEIEAAQSYNDTAQRILGDKAQLNDLNWLCNEKR